jgi:ATP-binding cassette, subfamily B, bacterial
MRKFPVYKQLDAMDCGPTCLRMVTKHYGRSYAVQDLREKAQIGKEGVSLLGIAEAAESIGFRTKSVMVSFEKLMTDAPLPCIVHWNQSHFVVVCRIQDHSRQTTVDSKQPFGFPFSFWGLFNKFSLLRRGLGGGSQGRVKVADPAKGLVDYSPQEFCERWLGVNSKGVALLLEPSPAFYAEVESPSLVDVRSFGFWHLFRYLWTYKALLGQLGLGLLAGSILQLIFPFLTQSIVDIGVNQHNLSFVYLVLFAQLLLFAGRMFTDFIRSWILLHISTRINIAILSDFLSKLMRLPIAYFDSKRYGDISQRLHDHQRIESFLTGSSLNTLFSLVNLFIFGAVLTVFNFTVFFIFCIGSGLYALWITLFLRYRRHLDIKRFDIHSKEQSAVNQLIMGMQEIKLNNCERQKRWEWENIQARLFKLSMQSLALNQYQQIGGFFLNEGKNILITFFTAKSVIEGQLTLGAMLAIQYIIGQLNSPVEQFIQFLQNYQDAKLSLERLQEVHQIEDEEPYQQPKIRQLPENKTITIKNLSFTYIGAGNEPVLQDINLVIPQGKVTAIVGTSGSGKTTLLKLLLKSYNPTKGEIRLGEASLNNLSHRIWRSQCGTVMQDGFIFSDTIARNIALGEDYPNMTKLLHATQVANIQEFIESLPLGYQTKIGAEGNGISQGQKQRILIARAVYKNPEFLFFDEATNALDAHNERVILENLQEFFAGKTVVVVAHRLSTVKNADKIIVLEKGKIIEEGTHQELTYQQGNYYHLVKNQLELGA